MQLVRTRKFLAAVASVAAVGLIVIPVGLAKDPLPEGGSAKQQDADMAFLKAAMEKKARNSIDPVRTTAILIAQNAQNRMDGAADAEALAGLRDQMVKISDALGEDTPDWDAAAKAFAGVSGAKGKPGAVKLHESKEYYIDVLMNVFKKASRGGRGWEDDLIEQSKKATDPALALEIAQGCYLVGQLAEHLDDELAGAKKKQWDEYCEEMRKVSLEAATEAMKGKSADMDLLTKKLEAVYKNCTDCHAKFK